MPAETAADNPTMSKAGIAVIVAAFIALQAANSAAVSIMSLFVTETLGLDVMWAGAALWGGSRAGDASPVVDRTAELPLLQPSADCVWMRCVWLVR
jgi:hypothetical protein